MKTVRMSFGFFMTLLSLTTHAGDYKNCMKAQTATALTDLRCQFSGPALQNIYQQAHYKCIEPLLTNA